MQHVAVEEHGVSRLEHGGAERTDWLAVLEALQVGSDVLANRHVINPAHFVRATEELSKGKFFLFA